MLLVLVGNLVVFLSLGAAACDGTLPLGKLVTFASAAVSTSMIAFGGLSWALDGGFDLTIPVGSSLAIVGRNGAAKTTLAKLLCRLHDPQEGWTASTFAAWISTGCAPV